MTFLVSCYQALLDILFSPHLHILNLLHPRIKRCLLILPCCLLVRKLLPKSAYLPPFLFEQQVHSFQASASNLRDEGPPHKPPMAVMTVKNHKVPFGLRPPAETLSSMEGMERELRY